jgi:predicted helicase
VGEQVLRRVAVVGVPSGRGRRDTGVDLVAKLKDGEGYAAIQCKFYDPSHRVSKGDLDAFFAPLAAGEAALTVESSSDQATQNDAARAQRAPISF